MSRKKYNINIFNILGFFLDGIPCVFIRSDIAHRAEINMKLYLSFYKDISNGLSDYKDFNLINVLNGLENLSVFNHEIRHFHDSLLTPSLFELFMLSAQQNFCIFQILAALYNFGITLPCNRTQLESNSNEIIDILLNYYDSYYEDYSRYFKETFRVVKLNGTDISINFLLETNAIIIELMTVRMMHNEETAKYYYYNKINKYGLKYKYLIDYFLTIIPDFYLSIYVLHNIICYCLYSKTNCSEKLVEILSNAKVNEIDWLLYSLPKNIIKSFKSEDIYNKRIKKIKIINIESKEEVQISRFTESLKNLIELPKKMNECRILLIKKYIKEFKLNPDKYLDNIEELPLPAILFYPEIEIDKDKKQEGSITIDAIPMSAIKKNGEEIFIMSLKEDEVSNEKYAIAGLMGIYNKSPIIPFEIVDLSLLGRYAKYYIFEKRSNNLYGSFLDDYYDSLLKKVVG